MLSAYAYLADGYLLFLRSLRHLVRAKLVEAFEEDNSEWWKDPVLKALSNKERQQFEKNVKELYVHQRWEGMELDPFEVLDPSHCAKIILHHHSLVFQLVFPNKREIELKLMGINQIRNSSFAHPRDATPDAKVVSAALRDMIHVLEQVRNDPYAVEIAQLAALASATDALALAHSVNDADGPQPVRGRRERVNSPQEALSDPSPPAEGHSDETPESSTAQRPGVGTPVDDDRTLIQITKAVRARRAANDGFAPLRYVWASLEGRHPGRFPDEAYLLEIVERNPKRFKVRRGANTTSVQISEVRSRDR